MRLLFSLARLSATALLASAAAAGEASPPRPPMLTSPQPATAWSGLYAGLGAGLSFTEKTNGFSYFHGAAAPQFATVPTRAFAGFSPIAATGSKRPATSFSTGAQLGYNYKVNERLVLGVEADMQGARF